MFPLDEIPKSGRVASSRDQRGATGIDPQSPDQHCTKRIAFGLRCRMTQRLGQEILRRPCLALLCEFAMAPAALPIRLGPASARPAPAWVKDYVGVDKPVRAIDGYVATRDLGDAQKQPRHIVGLGEIV